MINKVSSLIVKKSVEADQSGFDLSRLVQALSALEKHDPRFTFLEEIVFGKHDLHKILEMRPMVDKLTVFLNDRAKAGSVIAGRIECLVPQPSKKVPIGF